MAKVTQYMIRRLKLNPMAKRLEEKLYLAFDVKRSGVKWWGEQELSGVSQGSLLMMFTTREAAQEYLDRHELKTDHYNEYQIDEVVIRLDFKIPKPPPEPEPEPEAVANAAVPALP